MPVRDADPAPERLRIRFRGTVQGVGFRPFLHGLAARHGLSGFVLNDQEGVLAEVEGMALDGFMDALQRQRPPLARIDGMDVTRVPLEGQPGFAIAAARRPPAAPGLAPTRQPACLAAMRCWTRRAASTATLSSPARIAARVSPSRAAFPTTARTRRWRHSACARRARPITAMPEAAASTRRRSPARPADRGSATPSRRSQPPWALGRSWR